MTSTKKSDRPRLIVNDVNHTTFNLSWYFPTEQDVGGFLGQGQNDGVGPPPVESQDGEDADDFDEHHVASAIVREIDGVQWDRWNGFFWTSESAAKKALKVVNDGLNAHRAKKQALKDEKPFPDWAIEAIKNGWKAPKGWKPEQ